MSVGQVDAGDVLVALEAHYGRVARRVHLGPSGAGRPVPELDEDVASGVFPEIDPERIGIYGGSAGGHLSLMQGLAGDKGDPNAKDPVDQQSRRVAAVACFLPLIWASLAFGWGLVGIWSGLSAFMLARLVLGVLRLRSSAWAVVGAAR